VGGFHGRVEKCDFTWLCKKHNDSHNGRTENIGVYPDWGDNTTYEFARVYWEVVDLNQPNTYSLSVSEGTSISINSGAFQYLSGNYTISVGQAQSSVSIAGVIQPGQIDPYLPQNVNTIAIRYNILRRTMSVDYYKKSGFIKYVTDAGLYPNTGYWTIEDIENQALQEFGGTIDFDKIMGNLPLDKLQDLDMSKITTGNLTFGRIDGNLPANKLDNLDMSKITTGQLYYNRIQDQHLLVIMIDF
jgi:hypothetical protein